MCVCVCHGAGVSQCRPKMQAKGNFNGHTHNPAPAQYRQDGVSVPGVGGGAPGWAGMGPTAEGSLKATPLQSAAQASSHVSTVALPPPAWPLTGRRAGEGSNQTHGQTSRSQSTRSWSGGREQGPPSNHARVERGWVVSQGPLLQGPKPQFPHLTLSTQ